MPKLVELNLPAKREEDPSLDKVWSNGYGKYGNYAYVGKTITIDDIMKYEQTLNQQKAAWEAQYQQYTVEYAHLFTKKGKAE